MDTSATNGYLLSIYGNEDIAYRGHRNYQETLATELLMVTDNGQEQVVEPIVASPQTVPGWRAFPR
jgi:hypothetical protein